MLIPEVEPARLWQLPTVLPTGLIAGWAHCLAGHLRGCATGWSGRWAVLQSWFTGRATSVTGGPMGCR
ncbi:hypothetical protein SAMN05444921_12353 [Streptomyces wuyuanensis]|uniref:Uncharacterized protein n=1 Tax=Streptomyces wuyuanensis TaxID=1196353 RepID=A0A1H0A310_9ACTN|nr:hypothetical protein SAMN05444921_12353 [Streptomyces wuyuanensis]